MLKRIQAALEILQKNSRTYLTMNALYFGVMSLGMLFTSINRPMQQAFLKGVSADLSSLERLANEFTGGAVTPMIKTPSAGIVLAVIVLIFATNFILGSFLEITLPSLIIPLSGLLVGLLRAFLWGVIFLPNSLELSSARIAFGLLGAILIILEGEGYVLAMFAAYLQGKAFLIPQSVGAVTRRQGYGLGIKHSARVYLLVALVLAIAATHEALTVLFIAPARS